MWEFGNFQTWILEKELVHQSFFDFMAEAEPPPCLFLSNISNLRGHCVVHYVLVSLDVQNCVSFQAVVVLLHVRTRTLCNSLYEKPQGLSWK